jgi:hypothetical protein
MSSTPHCAGNPKKTTLNPKPTKGNTEIWGLGIGPDLFFTAKVLPKRKFKNLIKKNRK